MKHKIVTCFAEEKSSVTGKEVTCMERDLELWREEEEWLF